MDKNLLNATAVKLTKPPKGILAIDESPKTCNPRFEKMGIEPTEENRRIYRGLLISAPGLNQYISGFIMQDETIRQSTKEGKSFVAVAKENGMEVGIKVDMGLKDFPDHAGEKISQGLEGLPERLKEYRAMGAVFAKWRTEIHIGAAIPTEDCIKENAKIFAEYALACQAENIVPIVEPEVMFPGNHTIERCYEVTCHTLDVVFAELKNRGVYIPGIILKTSMVIPGKDSAPKAPELVAEMTLKCLREHVPADIGGIVFLSGGQTAKDSTLNLNAMHQDGALPWNLSFSYSRGIQNPVLEYWGKNFTDIVGAQKILVETAKANSLASEGKFR